VDHHDVVITGTGLFTPPYSISNEELAASLSIAVDAWNETNAAKIETGELTARTLPDAEFIEKASGIKSRFVMERDGILDPTRLRPHLPLRDEDELGLQAEMALPAIHEALGQAGRRPDEVDCVIVGCSNLQRAYPAVAIEIQHALGAGGWAYDMNVACSSATFSMQAGIDALSARLLQQGGDAMTVARFRPNVLLSHTSPHEEDTWSNILIGDVAIGVGTIGLIWGVLYLRRRSVVAAMVSHAGFDVAEVLFQLLSRTMAS
jgi:beta-ketodecanoyl-[acyl-carrier-protein] synthase